MSNAIFPALASIGWSVKKTPQWNTIVQKGTNSGRELRTALYPAPLWTFALTYDVLRTSSGIPEYQTLVDFFNQRQGSFDDFLYNDPYDNTVVAQPFGIGTGSQTAFQLVRQIAGGGYSEPIQNVNGTPSVFINGVQSVTLSPPAAPTLSDVVGGGFSFTTYYVKVTYVGPQGETLASAESSRSVLANRLLQVISPAAIAGAVAYHVYVFTTTGGELKQTGSSPIAIGTNWTMPTSGLVAGAPPPVVNTTGWIQGSTGLLTFTLPPAAAAVLTWSGNFYFRCRFLQDSAEFEQFVFNLWKLGKLELQSLRL